MKPRSWFARRFNAGEPSTRARGRYWEWRALLYLRVRGLRLVARNYSSPGGEIDLIMRDGDTLAFVEVRYRRRRDFGSPAESVDWRKRRRIVACAGWFLSRNPRLAQTPCRFDILALGGGARARTEWLKGAFEAEE